MEQPTHVTLPVDLVNRVMNYLVQRPFIEVSEMVLDLKVTADASFRAQMDAPAVEA